MCLCFQRKNIETEIKVKQIIKKKLYFKKLKKKKLVKAETKAKSEIYFYFVTTIKKKYF